MIFRSVSSNPTADHFVPSGMIIGHTTASLGVSVNNVDPRGLETLATVDLNWD